jgi:ketosteroid isomerase-like protein
VSSDDRIELVRRFHEGWIDEKLDTVLGCIHPDMEFDWSESRAPFRGVYHGEDGMRTYWHDVREAFEGFRPEIEELIDCGAGGVVSGNVVRGRSRSSGIELEAHGAVRWLFRDGRIVSGKLFQTTAQALEAARGHP